MRHNPCLLPVPQLQTHQAASTIKPIAKRAVILCDCLLHKASLSSSCACFRAHLVAAETGCKKVPMSDSYFLLQNVANKQPHGACTFRALTHLECINFPHDMQSCAILCQWKQPPVSGTPGIESNHIKPNIKSDSWSLGCEL